MATETQNQNIFLNTILNLKQRGVIQDLPPSLTNHISAPQIDYLRGNLTQKTNKPAFSFPGWHQQNAFQNSRNDMSHKSINCINVMSTVYGSQQRFPSRQENVLNIDREYSKNTSIGGVTRCSTPLRQSDYLFQPIDSNIDTNRELNNTQSSLGSLVIEDNEETNLVVSQTTLQQEIHIENRMPLTTDLGKDRESVKNDYDEITNLNKTFDCFPSGFESDSPPNNFNVVGTGILQPVEEPVVKESNIQIKNKSKFTVPIKSTLRDSKEIGEDTTPKISEQIAPTSSADLLLYNKENSFKDEEINVNESSTCMEVETSDTMIYTQINSTKVNTGISKSNTNKKRGTKR